MTGLHPLRVGEDLTTTCSPKGTMPARYPWKCERQSYPDAEPLQAALAALLQPSPPTPTIQLLRSSSGARIRPVIRADQPVQRKETPSLNQPKPRAPALRPSRRSANHVLASDQRPTHYRS